ncbi:unnamed protein product [Microthlaspi erraticum]|uniref:Uncharacterized protein n=1 Tax=Microthlaspi erraticum TaxID=1685480 RepID=A0A6D2K1V6_9BRAS|nr:unnamed protein product [Microthlaspi erraticum]
MGRAPCCDKANVKRGPWSPEEDAKLKDYIENQGTGGNWIALPQKAGLRRCGKSCRLRWLNYLRPNIRHGDFTEEEDKIICNLFASIGSRWSVIAAHLHGRTDNDIKNYWNTKLKKKLIASMAPPPPHHLLAIASSSPPSSSSSHYNMINNLLPYNPSISANQMLTPHEGMMMTMMGQQQQILYQEDMGSMVNSPNSNKFIMSHQEDSQKQSTNKGILLLSDVRSGSSSTSTVTRVKMEEHHDHLHDDHEEEERSMSSVLIEDYGMEEIKQLINTSCTSSSNSLWVDENKIEDKFMMYY